MAGGSAEEKVGEELTACSLCVQSPMLYAPIPLSLSLLIILPAAISCLLLPLFFFCQSAISLSHHMKGNNRRVGVQPAKFCVAKEGCTGRMMLLL